MSIQTKPASPDDVELILDYMKAYYQIEGHKYDRQKSKRAIEKLLNDTTTGGIWLVYCDNEPIGYYCLAYSYTLASYGKDCFLDEIYIKPAFQNRGLGSKLMNIIISNLKDNGFKGMHLVVYDHNKKANNFYLKNKFVKNDASFMTLDFL